MGNKEIAALKCTIEKQMHELCEILNSAVPEMIKVQRGELAEVLPSRESAELLLANLKNLLFHWHYYDGWVLMKEMENDPQIKKEKPINHGMTKQEMAEQGPCPHADSGPAHFSMADIAKKMEKADPRC